MSDWRLALAAVHIPHVHSRPIIILTVFPALQQCQANHSAICVSVKQRLKKLVLGFFEVKGNKCGHETGRGWCDDVGLGLAIVRCAVLVRE